MPALLRAIDPLVEHFDRIALQSLITSALKSAAVAGATTMNKAKRDATASMRIFPSMGLDRFYQATILDEQLLRLA
jgi:hypothetical protein